MWARAAAREALLADRSRFYSNNTTRGSSYAWIQAAANETASRNLFPFIDLSEKGFLDFGVLSFVGQRITEDIPTLQFDYNPRDWDGSDLGFRGLCATHPHFQSWGMIKASLGKIRFHVQVLVRVGEGCNDGEKECPRCSGYKETIEFADGIFWTLGDVFEALYEVLYRPWADHVKLAKSMFLATRVKSTAPRELTQRGEST